MHKYLNDLKYILDYYDIKIKGYKFIGNEYLIVNLACNTAIGFFNSNYEVAVKYSNHYLNEIKISNNLLEILEIHVR